MGALKNKNDMMLYIKKKKNCFNAGFFVFILNTKIVFTRLALACNIK